MNLNLRWSLLLALLVSLPAHAAIWIKDFQRQPEDYRLERNGKTLPIQYYQILQTGDRLSMEKEGELRLERDDGTELVIRLGNSPYTVTAQDTNPGQAPGIWTNLVAWASGWLHARNEDGTAKPPVHLGTRNDAVIPLTLPLAPVAPIQLMAGERALHLTWAGGQPPFQIRLRRDREAALLVDQQVDQKRRFSSPPLSLTPGAYQLTIQDHRQPAVTLTVEVVAAAALPVPAAQWTVVTGTDSLKETVYAVWLAAQNEAWLLEAYQRAVLWQDRHPPAKWLMYSLEKGVRPTSPPAQPVASN